MATPDASSSSDVAERFWRQAERRLRRRLFVARLFEALRIPFCWLGACGLLVGVAMKRWGVATVNILSLQASAVGLLTVFVGVRIRRAAITEGGLFPRIDEFLKFHSRLSAASEGVGTWPQPQARVEEIWKWNHVRWMTGPAVLLGLMTCLLWVPAGMRATRFVPSYRPALVGETEDILAGIESNEGISEESVKELREELERLKAKDARDWYSQAGLAAASQLRLEIERGGQGLAEQVERMRNAIADMIAVADGAATGDAAAERLGDALRAAAGLRPALESGLAEALKQVAAGGIRSMTAESFREMQERLKRAHERLGECGFCKRSVSMAGEGSARDGSGSGPSADAPSDTPLTFTKEQTRLDAAIPEALPPASPEGGALMPGDVVREMRRAPATQSGGSVGASSGALREAGAGSVGVAWRTKPVPPEEMQRLRRFFSGTGEAR